MRGCEVCNQSALGQKVSLEIAVFITARSCGKEKLCPRQRSAIASALETNLSAAAGKIQQESKTLLPSEFKVTLPFCQALFGCRMAHNH